MVSGIGRMVCFMDSNLIFAMPSITCMTNLILRYSQLVLASRKAETETLRSSVLEARVKSAGVGSDTALQVKGASSEPSYKALTQQIAYLMSTVTDQTNQNLSKSKEWDGSKCSNGNGTYSYNKFQKPKRDKKDMRCWGCGGSGHQLERVLHTQARE